MKRAWAAYNTALTHCRIRSSVTGDVFSREADSGDNPTRLSLSTRTATLHLSLSGSLMQKRYQKSEKYIKEGDSKDVK
ncbi:MAG TPA: hypothetical protein IAA29_10290 [Candidatus Paenibacillus intestinavium]|nr:hypothetical protein [Candidatus Paenibacillus intestinavium]